MLTGKVVSVEDRRKAKERADAGYWDAYCNLVRHHYAYGQRWQQLGGERRTLEKKLKVAAKAATVADADFRRSIQYRIQNLSKS